MICWVPIEIPFESANSSQKKNTQASADEREKISDGYKTLLITRWKIYFHSCNINCFGISSKANSLDVLARRMKLHCQLTVFKQFYRKIYARRFVWPHTCYFLDQLSSTTRGFWSWRKTIKLRIERRMCSRGFFTYQPLSASSTSVNK